MESLPIDVSALADFIDNYYFLINFKQDSIVTNSLTETREWGLKFSDVGGFDASY